MEILDGIWARCAGFVIMVHCALRRVSTKIVSTTAPERAVLSVLSLGVALWTWPIRCERGGRNVLFLSINLISFRRSRGIVLVMASPVREMDSAGRQWNIEKDVRNVRDFSVKRLPSGSPIAVWLNKRDTLLRVPTGTRNSACFEVGLICTVIDHVTVSERAA